MDVSNFLVFEFILITSVSSKSFLTFHCSTESDDRVSASIDAMKLVQKLDICPKEDFILGVENPHHRISTEHIAKGLQDRIIKEQVSKINITNTEGIFTNINLKKATKIKVFTIFFQERDTKQSPCLNVCVQP